MNIIYTILLDESSHIRGKEHRLSAQDTFVRSAMHEIKTPFYVIILNNELREMELGKANNLSNAIKYYYAGSSIEVILHKNILSFHSKGQTIKDRSKRSPKSIK